MSFRPTLPLDGVFPMDWTLDRLRHCGSDTTFLLFVQIVKGWWLSSMIALAPSTDGIRLLSGTLGMILPEQFRELHHAGFARFQITESSQVVNHPLELATICADGSVIRSEHFIVAEKDSSEGWSFAATLRPGGPPCLPKVR